MTYSVAIRTLGTAGEKFRRELESLKCQTVQPEKIVVYIAEGYMRPGFQIGKEEYVWVKKGMVAQRALPYAEIDSEYILMLDDDVELQIDSVEKLLDVAERECADAIGADTFRNQDMSLRTKLFAFFTNWIYPHFDSSWAFKVNNHCGFSYLYKPAKDYYYSQSCAGPASLWRKETLLKLHLEDELFLDKLGFAFGDDLLEFHKVFINGYKLIVHYNCGIEHLDGKSSSGTYHKNVQKFYIRSKGSFILWWRTCYQVRPVKCYVVITYCIKTIWLLLMNLASAIVFRNLSIPYLYIKGIYDAWHFVHSNEYNRIPLLNSYKR